MCDACKDEQGWISLPLESFQDGHYKVAVSLKYLVEHTNSFSTKNKDGCVATLLKSSPKEMTLHYNVKCSLKTSDPNGHDVHVKFAYKDIDDSSRYDNLDIKVSCSCPAHLYWAAQWNLHQLDALEGQPRPLLQAPTQRLDKRNGFLICKHAKVVLDRIIPSVQRNIERIKREQAKEQEFEMSKPTTIPKDNLEAPPKSRSLEITPKPVKPKDNLEAPPKSRSLEPEKNSPERVEEEQQRKEVLKKFKNRKPKDNLEAPPKSRGLDKSPKPKKIDPLKTFKSPVLPEPEEPEPADNLEAPPKARALEPEPTPTSVIRRRPSKNIE